MPSKRYYTIAEVSEILAIPATTLRYWENVFPLYNPNRSAGGQRRFTQTDVDMAKKIKELLYVKGLKVDAAIELLNKTYRKARPRGLRKCTTPLDAIALLDEVKAITEDAHATAKLDSVMKYLNTIGDVEK